MVISITMVKNEQDIIEPFIRHHQKLFDKMIVLDNGSVDDTRRILDQCAAEFPELLEVIDGKGHYHQSERMTALLKKYQEYYKADFVFLLDADEFVAATSRAYLKSQLGNIPVNGIGMMAWSTYVVHPKTELTNDVPACMTYRRAHEDSLFKAIIRLDGQKVSEAFTVDKGNHNIWEPGVPHPAVTMTFPLLHFPIRSLNQIISKGIVGHMAHMSEGCGRGGPGWQWTEIFDRVSDGTLSVESLGPKSLHYATNVKDIDWDRDSIKDTFAFDYVRKYSTGAYADPLVIVAKTWEASILDNWKDYNQVLEETK